ncbi:unnamed protein product [Onchocerca ochengi]|uniref:Transthyretin-like family protein n=1 Tax=Onchocerca ochengi TaxID=42157 RepID=A0A182EN50_ONCOC|nr:unnamed protein product [Onchocerca ochengi]
MRKSGCLFLLLEILQLFAPVNSAVGETVRIHGVLACGGAPVFAARLKLYDGEGLKDDGTTANHEDEFLFQIKNIEPSKLYLTIDHHCDGGILNKGYSED